MGPIDWSPSKLAHSSLRYKGATIARILGGVGVGVLLEINIFVGKMGEITNWPQDMVEINIFTHTGG